VFIDHAHIENKEYDSYRNRGLDIYAEISAKKYGIKKVIRMPI